MDGQMPNLIKRALVLALFLNAAVCRAGDAVGLEWSRLIKADFPGGCVHRLDQYLSTAGANGNRSGAWFVQTCQGNFEYGTAHVPAEAHSGQSVFSAHRQQAVRELTAKQIQAMYGIPQ